MPRQIGVALVAEDLAVDFQIRDGPPLLAPKRVPAERAVLRFEVFLSQRGRLDDVAVGIEHCKVLWSSSAPRTARRNLDTKP